MAYRIEGRDIVIDGFEKGISDNPFDGINNMRGVNLISTPGEASVNFGQYNVATYTATGAITAVNDTNDTVTLSVTGGTALTGPLSGNVQTYMAVVFTGSVPTGLTAGTTYWIVNTGSNVCELYDNCYLNGTKINLTSTTTGATYATVNMGRPKYMDKNFGFLLDANGRVWSPTSASLPAQNSALYTFMGNNITNASGNGLIVYRGTGTQYYLFVFKNARIQYTPVNDVRSGSYLTPVWVNDWDPATGATNAVNTLNTDTAIPYNHEAIVGQDNVIYFTDSNYVCSLREKSGSTFDPTSTATYVWNNTALALPKSEIAQCIEEFGTNIYIGGINNYVYPWDRLSTSFRFPILVAEKSINRMLTVNQSMYIFAGFRGRIFVTNSTNAQLFSKIPDHISGESDPTISINGVCYYKNQIYFGVLYGTTYSGALGTQYSGLWAIDIDTKALRCALVPSTSTASVTAVGGYESVYTSSFYAWGIIAGWWDSVSTTYGIDASLTTPSASYYTLIDTDIIPIGLYLNKRTFENIEFKLSKPLKSAEAVKISYRSNLNDSFVQVGETTSSTNLSDVYTVNFENVQWVQLRVELKSTTSSPSYVRLREVRIR